MTEMSAAEINKTTDAMIPFLDTLTNAADKYAAAESLVNALKNVQRPVRVRTGLDLSPTQSHSQNTNYNSSTSNSQ